jgi:biopolymer transport protein ExbD
VTVAPEGVALNGVPLADAGLAEALAPLVAAPDDAIVLRPAEDTDLQRLIDVMEALRAAGFTRLVVVE